MLVDTGDDEEDGAVAADVGEGVEGVDGEMETLKPVKQNSSKRHPSRKQTQSFPFLDIVCISSSRRSTTNHIQISSYVRTKEHDK